MYYDEKTSSTCTTTVHISKLRIRIDTAAVMPMLMLKIRQDWDKTPAIQRPACPPMVPVHGLGID